MADIKLELDGDSSGAVQALSQTGDATGKLATETGKSVVAWQLLAETAIKATTAIVKFGVDSVRAYAESERVQRQLTRAAGDYAAAIDEQSKALSKLYAVDDDLLNQSATLLAQWGGHAAASREAEEAALNLAAAMGTDLRTATEMLIRNVESGGTGLAKMGIHFEATGQKGEDFKRAVEAINGKLGGAAAADAGSLTGQLHAAELAFDDLKKSIGRSITEFLEQTGAVAKLTEGLRNLNEFLTNEGAQKMLREGERMTEWVDAQRRLAEAQLALRELMAEPTQDPRVLKLFQEDVTIAQARVDKLLASVGVLKGGTGSGSLEGFTNKGRSGADGGFFGDVGASWKKAFQEDTSEVVDAMAVRSAEIQAAEQKAGDEYEALMQAQAIEQEKIRKESLDAQDKMAAESYKAQRALEDKLLSDTIKAEEQAAEDFIQRAAKKEAEARQAGDQIGAAMVNALADQLAKLAEGGEFDAALFIGDILAAAVGVAGTVIGSAFGAPAVGAALGNLAAMGVRAGASAISRGGKPSQRATYHDGGWPRAHGGAWMGGLMPDEVPIIAQTGERVLSRAEVHHMGGRGAVDSMARGGGSSVTLNVTAIDAKSFADTMSDSGGKGLRDAIRRGHGPLPALLGASRGPR